jgi:hypothetical protein
MITGYLRVVGENMDFVEKEEVCDLVAMFPLALASLINRMLIEYFDLVCNRLIVCSQAGGGNDDISFCHQYLLT